MLNINVKHVGVFAGLVAGSIVGDALVKTVVKPIKNKIKKSKENEATVTIDGVKYVGVVEGA